jgi:hypothetical protein
MFFTCSLVYFAPTVPNGAVINAIISHPHSSPIVGMPYNLSCLYDVSEGFIAHEPTVLWIYPNQANFTTPSIVFDPLYSSDSGKYTCRVILTSPLLKIAKEVHYSLTIQRK